MMIIKLIDNPDYRYDEKYRFCGFEHAYDIKPVKECGAADIGEFYLHCLKAWTIETCSAQFRPKWSEDNPSIGQCRITAALVYEFFGGETFMIPLESGVAHSFNRINGMIIDLTSEQFGKNALPDFSVAVPLAPSEILSDTDKIERCALLRKNLGQYHIMRQEQATREFGF